uniref:Putative 5`-nucleotidase n=1 Tax=Magnetococcus massalia (strain MO-1) TaxID=451514 RepID=A0A1S7LDQ6_MAGMO|nr:Putative 5`-nucleotidase [Candidatus Magnetococcus massalia]
MHTIVKTVLAIGLIFLPGLLAAKEAAKSITLLTINDVYRIAGTANGTMGSLSRVRTLRKQLEQEDPNLLMLHAGDFLFPSMMSRLFKGEHMIDLLNGLDGDFSRFDERMLVTFGNHEFDKSKLKHAAMLGQRIKNSQFSWLASDIDFKPGIIGLSEGLAPNIIRSQLRTINGIKVGLFSITTDVKHPGYVERFLPPLETAAKLSAQLREQGAQVVIALTHQTVAQDMKIFRKLKEKGPDLIVGGHEHSRHAIKNGPRMLIKADADASSAAVIKITLDESSPSGMKIAHRFEDLTKEVVKDNLVDGRTAAWSERYNTLFCKQQRAGSDCLDKPLTSTGVELVAEELEIRKYETNLGSWVVDQAVKAFKPHGAQIAFINAGSMRLNQNVPRKIAVTMRHLEELFPYDNNLSLIEIDGKTLKQIVARAVTDWNGNGWWLQVSGFGYRFDPEKGTVSDLSLLTRKGPKPVGDDEKILAVTNDFLLNPIFGQDGYTMLRPEMVVRESADETPSLKQLVAKALARIPHGHFKPVLKGRICNTKRQQVPCLLDMPLRK